MSFLGSTAVAGVGYSQISRDSKRSVLSLAVEACQNAILDAGLGPQDIDGVASYSMFDDSVPTKAVATALAMPEQHYLLDLALGGQAPCFMVMNAAMAVASGAARSVVCFRALNGRSGVRIGSTPVVGLGAQYRYPIGFAAYVQYMAMWARRYMIETGATSVDLGAVAIAQRKHAALNPRALIRTPLSMDEYLASPFVAEPYRIADCTIEVDGACAVVVTSLGVAERARHAPALIRSAAYVSGPGSGLDIGDSLLWKDYSRNFTSLLCDRLWDGARLAPSDVDVAEIYDCFTGTVLMGIEGIGLAERGHAADLVRSGRLPVNTNGGLLCEGYLHGMNNLAEAVLQLQGRAAMQVPDAEVAVVTSGGMMDGSAMVLSKQ